MSDPPAPEDDEEEDAPPALAEDADEPDEAEDPPAPVPLVDEVVAATVPPLPDDAPAVLADEPEEPPAPLPLVAPPMPLLLVAVELPVAPPMPLLLVAVELPVAPPIPLLLVAVELPVAPPMPVLLVAVELPEALLLVAVELPLPSVDALDNVVVPSSPPPPAEEEEVATLPPPPPEAADELQPMAMKPKISKSDPVTAGFSGTWPSAQPRFRAPSTSAYRRGSRETFGLVTGVRRAGKWGIRTSGRPHRFLRDFLGSHPFFVVRWVASSSRMSALIPRVASARSRLGTGPLRTRETTSDLSVPTAG